MGEEKIRKVFISYVWKSEDYKERVLELAERLVRDGVDVILDQWDLNYGYDRFAFMERGIKDVDKVLILCEEEYATKANDRAGGVGTETQIITPALYGKYDQRKFIPVFMENPISTPDYLNHVWGADFSTGDELAYRDLFFAIHDRKRRPKPKRKGYPDWFMVDHAAKEVSDEKTSGQTVREEKEEGRPVKPELGKKPDWMESEKAVSGRQLPSLKEGDRNVPFGMYPYGADGEKKELLWRVLKVDAKEHKALLVTENLIDCRPYHEEWKDVTWEVSSLRGWMNGDFIREAFHANDEARIATMVNENPDNPRYGTRGGNRTEDKVFALSIDEAKGYFKSDRDRMAAPTPYAKKRGSYVGDKDKLPNGEGAGWWWLRSPGSLSNYAACVGYAGGVGGVDDGGSFVIGSRVSDRPALWLNL